MNSRAAAALSSQTQRFKVQGDAHFAKREFADAFGCYTDAVKLSPNDAELNAKCAESLLYGNHFWLAMGHCKKAVDLDPSLVKTWGHLAQTYHALGWHKDSVKTWDIALSKVPSSNPGMRTQFLEWQRDAGEDGAAAVGASPGERCEAIFAEGRLSSVLPLNKAQRTWNKGLDIINQQQITYGPDGKVTTVRVVQEGIAFLWDAVITDSRVVRQPEPDWQQKFTRQWSAENKMVRGWVKTLNPPRMIDLDDLKRQILVRLGTEERTSVRLAVEFTLKTWMVAAALYASKQQEKFAPGLALWERIVDILEWGRRETMLVKLQSAVFSSLVLKSVKSQRLDCLNQLTDQEGEGSQAERIAQAQTYAQDLLTEVAMEDPLYPVEVYRAPGPLQRAYLYAWAYPKANALATLGFITFLDLQGVDDKNLTPEEVRMSVDKGLAYYKECTPLYPEDDEQYTFNLGLYFDLLVVAEAPLRQTLAVCKRIRAAIPSVLEVWGRGDMGRNMPMWDELLKEFETDNEGAIKEGRATMETTSKWNTLLSLNNPRPEYLWPMLFKKFD